MSTIKTTYLQHPSASSPNLTLASDGTVSGGAGLGGLVHVATTTFTNVSQVNIDNCFSSEYANYRVLATFENTSGGTDVTVLFRSGGSNDATASNYDFTRTYRDFVSRPYNGSVITQSGDSYPIVCANVGNEGALQMDVFNPFLAKRTQLSGFANTSIAWSFWGVNTTTTSFDGFTFAGLVLHGSLSVYGYRNS